MAERGREGCAGEVGERGGTPGILRQLAVVSRHPLVRLYLHPVFPCLQEAVHMQALRHPNVVSFFGVSLLGSKGVLLMELCEGEACTASQTHRGS